MGHNIFSQIDLNMRYYQIYIDPDYTHVTAFVTTKGHYEFVRIPLGLTNAPRIFQKTMRDLFATFNLLKSF